MTYKSNEPQVVGWTETPLPGFYPCLTLQVNITRYASQQMGRMVLVVRDPQADMEVLRAIVPTSAWDFVRASASQSVLVAMERMRYLQDGHLTDTEGRELDEP